MKIIESIKYHGYSGANFKCFTLFSQICKVSRKLKIDLKHITIYLKADAFSFPPHINQKLNLFVHSPNSLPQFDQDTPIVQDIKKSLISTTIEYNQVTTELLDSSYDTNCFEYDIDYKFANFNMRSDCITYCSQNYLAQQCNITGYSHTGSLLRKKLLEQNTNELKYLDINKIYCVDNISDVDNLCQQKCKPDCIYRYYSTTHTQEEERIGDNYGELWFMFLIKHNSLPDVSITYLPQTTFLSLVCNFGGILGMWLGLSFINIINMLVLNIYRISRRPLIQQYIFFIRKPVPVQLDITQNIQMHDVEN